MRIAISLMFLSFLSFVSPAFAVDGVREINHACAVSAAGCFPGDSGGYPVTLPSTGGYRLTSDLRPPLPTQNAIVIEASLVSLDLNHFLVQGPWTSGPCGSGGNFGVGIFAADNNIGVSVRNGSVSGMSIHGIVLLGLGARVEDVVSVANCTTGVFLGSSAQVSDTQALFNGGHGIVVGTGAIVTRSIASNNRLRGILGNGPGTLISDSTASNNLETGIQAVTGGMVIRSTARQNGSGGSFPTNFGIDAPMVLESVSTQNAGRQVNGMVLGLALGDGNMSGELVGCIALDVAGTPSVSCPVHP